MQFNFVSFNIAMVRLRNHFEHVVSFNTQEDAIY